MLKSHSKSAKSPKTSARTLDGLLPKKTNYIRSSINMRASCQEYFADNIPLVSSHINGRKIRTGYKVKKELPSVSSNSIKQKWAFKPGKNRSKKISAGRQTTKESASDIKSTSPRHLTSSKTIQSSKSEFAMPRKPLSNYFTQLDPPHSRALQRLYERTQSLLHNYQRKILKLETHNRQLAQENASLKHRS